MATSSQVRTSTASTSTSDERQTASPTDENCIAVRKQCRDNQEVGTCGLTASPSNPRRPQPLWSDDSTLNKAAMPKVNGNDDDNDHSFSQLSVHKALIFFEGQSAWALGPFPVWRNRNLLLAAIIRLGIPAQTSCHLESSGLVSVLEEEMWFTHHGVCR